MDEIKNKARTRPWLLRYFSDWKNILTFLLLAAIVAAGLYLRVRNLGYLSFWGDDGHTFIGTVSILQHGYPRLPSGFVLFHGILGYYLNVIPVLIFGKVELAFRATSVFFGLSSIVVAYLAGKEISNKFTGFLAATLMSLSTWFIYFSREARYFSTFQFFFLLSVYFFYKGFVKEKRPFRVLATVFFVLTPLVHGLGFMLIICFAALLFYKGRRFFRRHIIIPLAIVAVLYILQIVNQVFFWEVGRSFYSTGGGILSTVSSYLRFPDPYYFKILNIMFPEMFVIFLLGVLIIIGMSIYMSIKGKERDLFNFENPIVIGKKVRIPYNILFCYIVFTVSVVSISFGQMYNQQRYIYFLMPVFVIIYSYLVYVISASFAKWVYILLGKIRSRDLSKKFLYTITILAFLVVAFFTYSGIDLAEANAIPDIRHTDSLNTRYSISTSMTYHWDSAKTGKYVAANASSDDIVITTDIYNAYPYTGKVDYWLWTGNLVSWQPYHLSDDGEVRDDTYGVVVIRDIFRFMEVFNQNPEKDIWVIAHPSILEPQHVDTVFRNFLENSTEEYVLTGRDGVSKLYLFKATGDKKRLVVTDFIDPESHASLTLSPDGKADIDFTDRDSSKYLISGWSSVEEGLGTWAEGDNSVIFLDISKQQDLEFEVTCKPLPYPDNLQTVTVYINQEKISSLDIAEEDFSKYTIPVEASFLDKGINVLQFEYGYSLTPQELGIADDSRDLSVMFKHLSVSGGE